MPLPIIPGLVEFPCETVPPEPADLIAGDSLAWQREFADYPASAGWTLTYVLNSATARFVVNPADVTTLGDTFNLAIPGSETKLWTPGEYQWLAVAQLAAVPGPPAVPAQRFTVALGRVVVSVDILDSTAPQDTRSPNEITLANIELQLSGRANDGVQEYTIQGRMLRRYSLSELMQLRTLYLSLVRQERAERGEYQLPTTVSVHFG